MPVQIKKGPKNTERFQVMVKARDEHTGVEKELRVGPILQFKEVLEQQVAAINKAVAEGREKVWRDARVVSIDKIEIVH